MTRNQILGLILFANGKSLMIINALDDSDILWIFIGAIVLDVIGIFLMFWGAKDD